MKYIFFVAVILFVLPVQADEVRSVKSPLAVEEAKMRCANRNYNAAKKVAEESRVMLEKSHEKMDSFDNMTQLEKDKLLAKYPWIDAAGNLHVWRESDFKFANPDVQLRMQDAYSRALQLGEMPAAAQKEDCSAIH